MTSSTQKENQTMRTTLVGAALLLTIAATTTSCGGSRENTAPPSASPEPTTSSASQTPEEKATAAAEAVINQFFATRNAVALKPATYQKLDKVAVGTVLVGWQNQFKKWKANGWRATSGGIKVTKMREDEVALNSKPPTVKITICTGVSGDVVDGQGRSVVKPGRPNLLTTQYTVAKYGGSWKVAVAQDQTVGSCTL